MTIDYTPNPIFPPKVTLPQDGDPANEETFVGIQHVADRTEHLKSVVAYKDQPNTFTQPQTFTSGGNSIHATGNVHADGGIEAYGHVDVGGSLYMNNPAGDLRYNPARTRVVTISVASGYPEGWLNVTPPMLDSDGWLKVPANAAIVYALPVPARAVMHSVSIKAGGSSNIGVQLKKRTGINMGAGNTSSPVWGDIKTQNFSVASRTVVSVDFNPSYTANPLEDYALRVVNINSQPDLIIYAIQLTYDENYIRTDGSR